MPICDKLFLTPFFLRSIRDRGRIFLFEGLFLQNRCRLQFPFLKKILQDPWQRFAEKDSASYVSWPKHCSKLTEDVRFSYPSNISTVLVG